MVGMIPQMERLLQEYEKGAWFKVGINARA
jgi:hypothetical protein